MTGGLLALLLAAQGVEITITAHTKDGNNVTGVTDVDSFPFESTLGKITVQLKDVSRLQFGGTEAVVATQDGTSLRGKIGQDAWKVKTKLGDFTLKTSDLVQITVLGARAAAPPPPPPPAALPAPAAPAKAAVPAGLAPTKTLKLGAAISRALRSGDGKTLYLLDASDSKIHVVRMETLEREKEIALAGGETSMALSPSGSVLVAAGKRTITTVSLPAGKMTKSFSIEQEVADVCAPDDQTVLASGQGGVFLISVAKQAVTARNHQSGGQRLYLSRDGKRIFTAGGTSIQLPDKAAGREELSVAYNSRSVQAGDFSLSPDGRFAVSPYGGVYRLAKSFVADFAEMGKVEPHWAAAWSSARKRLFLATSAGFVKEIDTDTWELARSWSLGYRLTDAWIDEAGGFLVGVGQPAPPGASDRESPRQNSQAATIGDLLRFEIPK